MRDDLTPPISAGEQGILDAAKELFSEHGFDGVSINAIAARAGVCKANVFHHFESKEALYRAVLERSCERFSGLLGDVLTRSTSLHQGVQDFAGAHLRLLFSDEARSRLVVRGFLDDSVQRGGDLVEQVMAANFALLVKLFSDARDRHELRADVDPVLPAFLLLAANSVFFQSQGILRRFAEFSFADDADRYSEMLCDVLLNGVKTPTPQST
ncbi:MAG: TetR/AcrR family transcriptional regulator [Pseudomonadota bacterium]|nr:TetR/AcrR family transcriptional regulator [Pseudomonadota bacterium]